MARKGSGWHGEADQEGLDDKVTFEQSSEEVREASMPLCGGRAIPKWEKGKCKGTEAETDIVYLQINHLTGAE